MLAARSQQVAGLTTLPAIVHRIVGKFRVDEEYKSHVNLELEDKYEVPLSKMLQRTNYVDMEMKGAREGLVSQQYKEHLPFNGSPVAEAVGTRLSNGVSTVAVDSSSPIVHLGVYLGVGKRHETRETAGILNVIKNAWLGTTTRRTYIGGHREPIQCGANVDFNVGRDMISITASCPRDKADLVMDHLTQNIICPEFFNHELLPAKKFAESQAAAALSDPAVILMEEAHRLAYRGIGLGRSLYYNKSNCATINRDAVLDFVTANFKDSNNTAVVGVGMDSETMCELADEYLWALEGGSASSTPSTWTGMREAHVEAGGAETRALYLCEGATVGSRDQLIMELLKQMLGGGPATVYRGANHGKLITSAAPYTSHPFSVDCVSLSYSDSGMWGLSVTAHGDEIGDVLKSSIGVVRELVNSTDEDVQRAKNKLKHHVIAERESRAGILSNTAQESIFLDGPVSTTQVCDTIDSITTDEVVSTVTKIISSSPVLVSHGNGEHMPLQREL